MTEDPRDPGTWTAFDRILSGAWSERVLEDALLVLAEGVCEVAGFGVAAISVLREPGQLEVVAVSGDADAAQELLGSTRPLTELDRDFADAEDWGALRFVPHEAVEGREDDLGWIPDYEPLDRPDAWRPLDLLFAPLCNDDGELHGVLSVDLPADGVRPDAERQRRLTRYVAQASRAVGALLEREQAAGRLRLAAVVREVVGLANEELSLDHLLSAIQPALLKGFGVDGLWVQAFENLGRGRHAIHAPDGHLLVPGDVNDIAHRAALEAWHDGNVMVVAPDRVHELPDPTRYLRGLQFLAEIGLESAIIIPLGTTSECLGILVLARRPGAARWDQLEVDAALDLGRDLGRVVFNIRTVERERQVLAQVRALDAHKGQLIATVTHEFKNPLTGILGHLELLEDEPLPEHARRSLDVIGRGAHKLESLATDLLELARAQHPDRPLEPVQLDLRPLVDGVVELNALQAKQAGVELVVEAPDGPVLALGEPLEIERVCANLVSNAVKYSPDGGRVRIRLAVHKKTVTLAVTDQGLGISAADQERLFGEFFRSTNPRATTLPGTGLGLAIVRRIIERHGGHIAVSSTLGSGSEFTVSLPRPTD